MRTVTYVTRIHAVKQLKLGAFAAITPPTHQLLTSPEVHEGCARTPVRQGPQGREFSGRVLGDRARHRGLILAFYEFVRIADDIADHATLSAAEKLAQLDRLEAELLGNGDGQAEALRLRTALTARGMSAQHPCDVLTAFRMDVTKLRYADWNELIHYCTLFGDAGRPLRARRPRGGQVHLGRVGCAVRGAADHQPHPGLRRRLSQSRPRLCPTGRDEDAGMTIEMIGGDRSAPEMAAALRRLTAGTERLLNDSLALAPQVVNLRLALEIGVIQTYAGKS